MRSLIIKFDTDLVLRFAIENHAIADLWIERFEQRHSWPMDDPSRFYGLGGPELEKQRAVQDLERCIETINSYQYIIDQSRSDLENQDTLNYLHSVFEKYHGLLDQQDTEWWQAAPEPARKALADLNIAVHRMESTQHNAPRIVCTWFGMPKDHVLPAGLMRQHGTLATEWGGVYLNYVEIGKTLEDLAMDNDRWIGNDAFRPFQHYSADFNVKFYDAIASIEQVQHYWEAHKNFFLSRGVNHWDDAAALPYRFKIAGLRSDLDRQSILTHLGQANHIVDVYLA